MGTRSMPMTSFVRPNNQTNRYYACEALYNVSKVSFSGMLTYFNELFVGLTEIYAEQVPPFHRPL